MKSNSDFTKTPDSERYVVETPYVRDLQKLLNLRDASGWKLVQIFYANESAHVVNVVWDTK